MRRGFQARARRELAGARADRRRRASRVLRTGRRTAYWLLSWPRADRVLGLGTIASGRSPVAVLDPRSGRALHDALIEGDVVTGVATPEGLAVLVAPAATIGEAALVLIDAEGAERRIALPGVLAGSEPPGKNPEPRSVMPGLAVRDGARTWRPTPASSRSTSPAASSARTRSSGPARRKRAASQRSIQFVGPHTLAVSGARGRPPGGPARRRHPHVGGQAHLGRRPRLGRPARRRPRGLAVSRGLALPRRRRHAARDRPARALDRPGPDGRPLRLRRHACGRRTAPTSSTCAAGASSRRSPPPSRDACSARDPGEVYDETPL